MSAVRTDKMGAGTLMTAEGLRDILLQVADQRMTVRELRNILLLIDNQEEVRPAYALIKQAEYIDQNS